MFMANDLTHAGSEGIQSLILTIRGQRVMLDSDLARLFGVPTKRLLEQFKRNRNRFPADFAFQVDREEFVILRSQIATSSFHGGRRYLPVAFTEHGAIMLATILNSPVAVDASVRIVRAFVYLREQLLANRELPKKFNLLENRLDSQDESIAALFEAIRRLLEPPVDGEAKNEIGLHIREEAPPYRVRVNRKR